jgi:hypothetical protein
MSQPTAQRNAVKRVIEAVSSRRMTVDQIEIEVERVLAMTDEEFLAECAARGDDVELIAAEGRAMIELAMLKCGFGPLIRDPT